MEYLVRFGQVHETFRIPELESLAVIEGVDLKILDYKEDSPFCIVRLASDEAATRLIRRSILVQNIHHLWGAGATLNELHASVKAKSSHLWDGFRETSFKVSFDSFQGKRPNDDRMDIIKAFAFLPFGGEISMRNPDEEFTIFELWPWMATVRGIPDPNYLYFGRYVATGARDATKTYDLKKRWYISTTSMDSELSLITANIALAAPGKLIYDPFVGTGSFPIACAHFGAITFGSDIDGRQTRGEGGKKTMKGNFEQYGLLDCFGDVFTADLTNSPIRRLPLGQESNGISGRLFDGIVCDPPYGVREGLKVLGVRDAERKEWIVEAGKRMYKEAHFIPPKKPYGFLAMLDDILQFAAQTLVDNGRLSFWMPTANDEQQELAIPSHPYMERVSVCTQVFSKWSRRLITYRRKPDIEVDLQEVLQREKPVYVGRTADELNPFRKSYFSGYFKTETESES